MAQLAPPPPPPIAVTLADNNGRRRLEIRFWQLLYTGLTILLTSWFVMIGPISAILALMVAKHVLVAILVMGFELESEDIETGQNR